MAILANILVVACLGLMPDGPVAGPGVQTIVVVPEGGTVLLGGLKATSVPNRVVQTTVLAPDGGTILLGGLKRLSGSVTQPAVVVPDGGTVLLGGLKRLR
jgi:type II secretory pathway component GspD/PulD (secretin)